MYQTERLIMFLWYVHRKVALYMMSFFFFNDTATTEIYTLSLHDALPICASPRPENTAYSSPNASSRAVPATGGDRKSTRLNSSHLVISYAVFCLKKKKISADRMIVS